MYSYHLWSSGAPPSLKFLVKVNEPVLWDFVCEGFTSLLVFETVLCSQADLKQEILLLQPEH